jgi:hypothetical protein
MIVPSACPDLFVECLRVRTGVEVYDRALTIADVARHRDVARAE